MAKSIFDPTGSDEPLRGGMDSFLGPAAGSYSNVPEALTDGEVDEDDDVDVDLPKTAGDSSDVEPAVNQIADALDQLQQGEETQPAAKSPTEGPG